MRHRRERSRPARSFRSLIANVPPRSSSSFKRDPGASGRTGPTKVARSKQTSAAYRSGGDYFWGMGVARVQKMSDEKGKAMAGIDDDEARETREGKREVLSNTWHKALKNV